MIVWILLLFLENLKLEQGTWLPNPLIEASCYSPCFKYQVIYKEIQNGKKIHHLPFIYFNHARDDIRDFY
jgi:hypothetical protein